MSHRIGIGLAAFCIVSLGQRWPSWVLFWISVVALVSVPDPVSAAAEGANRAKDAESAWAKDESRTIGGVVQDATGGPVSRAHVWLVGHKSDEPQEILAETVTAEDGRFSLRNLDAYKHLFSRYYSLSLLARDRQNQLGWSRAVSEASATDLVVTLRAVADFKFRLVDSSGEPIQGATVRPVVLNRSYFGERGPAVVLPEKLSSLFSAQSFSDGSYLLPAMPTKGSFRAKVIAEGFGSPWVVCDLRPALTVRLEPAGSLNGRLTCAAEDRSCVDTGRPHEFRRRVPRVAQ